MGEPPQPGPDAPAGPAPARPMAPGSAALTGGVSGSAMATFAQSLREPYRTYVMLLAPAMTAAITSFWPLVLAELARAFRGYRAERRDEAARKGLARYKADLNQELSQPGLSRERKEELRTLIKEADEAIIAIHRRSIQRLRNPSGGEKS